ncbi:hypothetical protein PsorP6_010805 [Peronosclerospora sorghi]|uniref:Uncharacterized protein n=1 Tax=Peronosclerospora sorghi TaxID=230839 RepID=A0ACC0VUH0_9STRA|nr:hypothetical protein PsorP6_010805 [Peronosclerospora sorghi]
MLWNSKAKNRKILYEIATPLESRRQAGDDGGICAAFLLAIGKTQLISHAVAKKADSLELSNGQPPVTVDASVIYLVAAYTNAKRSIQEVSEVTMIGEKSMKRVFKELNKSRVILFEGVAMT